MLRPIYIFIVLFFALQISGCKESDDYNSQSEIEYVKYGTSFGECLGYCIKDISINNTQVVFSANGWSLDGILSELKVTINTSKNEWNKLTDNINLTAFNNLDTVIGCPDCADGGAEWIEIKSENSIHKVTFEYMNEPEETSDYIANLRIIQLSFEE